MSSKNITLWPKLDIEKTRRDARMSFSFQQEMPDLEKNILLTSNLALFLDNITCLSLIFYWKEKDIRASCAGCYTLQKYIVKYLEPSIQYLKNLCDDCLL